MPSTRTLTYIVIVQGCAVKRGTVDSAGVCFLISCYIACMDTREAGRLGAAITNKKLTKKGRRIAALKGWSNRKKKLKKRKISISKLRIWKVKK